MTEASVVTVDLSRPVSTEVDSPELRALIDALDGAVKDVLGGGLVALHFDDGTSAEKPFSGLSPV